MTRRGGGGGRNEEKVKIVVDRYTQCQGYRAVSNGNADSVDGHKKVLYSVLINYCFQVECPAIFLITFQSI